MKVVFNYKEYTKEGWRSFEPFKEGDISSIHIDLTPSEDPRTAVPSPYARFELMQQAFGNVAKMRGDAQKRDRKLVSQSLDVMQFVFEGAKGVDIVEWNLAERTRAMEELGETFKDKKPGMYLYAKSLVEYARRENYGLGKGEQHGGDDVRLFILRHGEDALGMTCPTSIFMPTPNYRDREWKNFKIESGTLSIFSKDRDLRERNSDFVLYLYRWMAMVKGLNGNILPNQLQQLSAYLDYQREIISRSDRALYKNIETIIANGAELDANYEPLCSNGQDMSVMGYPLYRQSKGKVEKFIASQSDLVIKSTLQPEATPLVLSTNITSPKVYTAPNVYWDSKNPGFSYNEGLAKTPIDSRNLPNGIEYSSGFLFDEDFLAEYLIKLPYDFNSAKFFTPEIDYMDPETCGFLPPVTPRYFEYFTTEDLKKSLRLTVNVLIEKGNSKKDKEDKKDKKSEISSIVAELDVPVRGKTVTLKRTYIKQDRSDNNKDALITFFGEYKEAKGTIITCPMALTVCPFVDFPKESMNDYSVQLVSHSQGINGIDKFGLEVYKLSDGAYRKIEPGEELKEANRRENEGKKFIKTYSIRNNRVDYFIIKLRAEDTGQELFGFVIPEWEIYRPGNKSFDFSFDFGTSNSYIAVKDNQGDNFVNFTLPMSLQASTILKTNDKHSVKGMINYREQEMLPDSRKEAPFPMASVVSTPKKDLNGDAFEKGDYRLPFFLGSIPFEYGYRDYGSYYNEINENLKWNFLKKMQGKEDQYAAMYINEVMSLARGFAIERNADLSKCRILWTYPVSMSKKEIRKFGEVWRSAYRRYFDSENGDENIESLPESVAPLLYYNRRTAGTSVSVDIGGGTCDVVINKADERWEVMSFKFGAENLFGLPNVSAGEVPMVRDALDSIRQSLSTAKCDGTTMDACENAATSLKEAKECASMSVATRMLFALSSNKELRLIRNNISYNSWLREHLQYRHIFLYYYAAIIYYIAQYMSHRGYDSMPNTILFSGSGSRMLDVLVEVVGDDGDSELEELTTKMFRFFWKEGKRNTEWDISVNRERREPKQLTAKGAISPVSGEAERRRKQLLNPDNLQDFISNFYMIDSVDSKNGQLTYGMLSTKEIQKELTRNVVVFNEAFLDFVERYGDDYDVDVSKLGNLVSFPEERIFDEIKKGINDEDISNEEKKEEIYPETPFFIGVKRILMNEILRKNKK